MEKLKLILFKWFGRTSILFLIVNTINNIVLPGVWKVGLEFNLLALACLFVTHYFVVETKVDIGVYSDEEAESAHLF